MKNILFLGKLF